MTQGKRVVSVPDVSNCGRPARPIICSASVIGKSTYRFCFECKKEVSVLYIAMYGQTVTSFGKTVVWDLGKPLRPYLAVVELGAFYDD